MFANRGGLVRSTSVALARALGASNRLISDAAARSGQTAECPCNTPEFYGHLMRSVTMSICFCDERMEPATTKVRNMLGAFGCDIVRAVATFAYASSRAK